MTTSPTQEMHTLTSAETDGYERRAGFLIKGECSCHNPDENGDGRQDFLAYSEDELLDRYDDHLRTVAEQEANR